MYQCFFSGFRKRLSQDFVIFAIAGKITVFPCLADIFDESVFAFILAGNLMISKEQGKAMPCHFVWYCVHSAPRYTGIECCISVLGLTRASG